MRKSLKKEREESPAEGRNKVLSVGTSWPEGKKYVKKEKAFLGPQFSLACSVRIKTGSRETYPPGRMSGREGKNPKEAKGKNVG